ncbi:hypothetical protein AAFN60_18920 [Roseibacillus persicicus]|uniref:hypothetical protein n=1 Tax=Roseibacillus persicicus TaxID=454148 RepID=UPI00398BA69D
MGSTLDLDWYGILGRSYFLRASEDLVSWEYAPFAELGADSDTGYAMMSTAAKAFFRLIYTDIPTGDPEEADFDNDGYGSLAEILILGTDPFIADTDGDGTNDGAELGGNGLADGWELIHFGATGQPANGDGDNDSMSNEMESLIRSNPNAGFEAPASGASLFTLYIPN